ncbi:ATP-binding protein [Kitasatospora acidiphila]|uniref:ATP-binding protein n=1 Tax=Kitasatospora acidiphila TaxID=2567942 RepID=UPI001E3CC57F|nr:BTAD domain-containing putative transcriptional regulator [Kitasatospora acidiphila]
MQTGGGRSIEIGSATLRALLARLALVAGQAVTAEALVDDLWGAELPAGAANALQRRVSRLRRVLASAGEPDALHLEAGGYRLAFEPDAVDALRFQRLAEQGRAALAAGHTAQAAELLRAADRLWRGAAALTGLGEAPFAAPAADRLAATRLLAAEDRHDAELALGRAAALLPELEQLAAAHPWRERLQGQLMRALQATGRQAEALAVYQRVRTELAEQLGVEPSAELAAVQLDVLRRIPQPRPAATAPAPRPAIPAGSSSFVGRAAELRQVYRLLTTARLVTVLGPGGAGKTRFVRELLARHPEQPFGEAWFVDLAAVADPGYVAQTVLVTVGPQEQLQPALADTGTASAGGIAERIVAALRPRPVLLVLDNCEHLAAAVALLAGRLLADCPELRILATSREVLGLTGEQQFPLPPLGLPAPGSPTADAPGYPAVRLFLDRAAAVRPGFSLGPESAPAVIEICRRLDGLPLAIELAAARIRILDPQELARRLDDRFQLLANSDRTAPARHQTLRAVVDWSWSMLEQPQRMLARRLTVFAGGATLEDIEQLCGTGPELPRAAVLDTLAALVDKSLVEVGEPAVPGTGTRYRMLDTIRAYCAERLAETGETEQLQRAHALHWTAFAQAAEPRLRTGEQLPWLARLRAEHPNLFAALRRSLDAGQHGTALRLCAALMWPWLVQGARYDYQLVDRVLALPGAGLPTERTVIATAHALVLSSAFAGGAPELGRRAVARAREHADRAERGAHPVLVFLAPIDALLAHDRARARQELTAVMPEAEPWTEALALMLRGLVLVGENELDQARSDVARARDIFAVLGDRWGRYLGAQSLASIIGEPATAAACYREALACLAELGMDQHVPVVVAQLGYELVRAGEPAAAQAELTRALALAEHSTDQLAAVWATGGLVELANRSGDSAEAQRRFGQLRRALAQGAGAALLPAMLSRIAGAMLRQGEVAGARDNLRQAVDLTMAATDAPDRRAALRILADRAGANRDFALAATLFGIAADPDPAGPTADLRGHLGDEAFEAAYHRGAALDLDAVSALATPAPEAAAAPGPATAPGRADEAAAGPLSASGQRPVRGRSAD